MRARRAVGIAVALAIPLVAWLVLRGGSEDRERAESEAAAAAAARTAAARESERGLRARAAAEREGRAAERRLVGGAAAEFGPAGDGRARRPGRLEGDDVSTDPLKRNRVDPIHLNPLVLAPNRSVVEITGIDPDAPRELVAWRIKDGKYAILVRGESDEAGRLLFPPVVAAGAGLEIVITDADSRPGLPGASDERRLAPRPPEAPHARVLATDAGEAMVRIVPTEATGAVLLADIDGTVFARYPLRATPPIGTRAFDVAIAVYDDDAEVLLAHEFTDGRRSEWRALSVATETVLDAGSEAEGYED